MHAKRGQTWSIETYLAIGVFLTTIIFFYSLITNEWDTGENIDLEVQRIAEQLITGPELGDGIMSSPDLEHFVDLNCSQLQELFNTNREICIYLQDQNGNLIENGTHVIHGIGCPGINVSNMLCGQAKPK